MSDVWFLCWYWQALGTLFLYSNFPVFFLRHLLTSKLLGHVRDTLSSSSTMFMICFHQYKCTSRQPDRSHLLQKKKPFSCGGDNFPYRLKETWNYTLDQIGNFFATRFIYDRFWYRRKSLGLISSYFSILHHKAIWTLWSFSFPNFRLIHSYYRDLDLWIMRCKENNPTREKILQESQTFLYQTRVLQSSSSVQLEKHKNNIVLKHAIDFIKSNVSRASGQSLRVKRFYMVFPV